VAADRRRLNAALARTDEGAQTVDLRFRGDPAAWTVSLRALAPATVVATLTRNGAGRFPQAVVALHRDLRVAFANGRAGELLGRDAVRAGAQFGDGVPAELQALAHRLTELQTPLDSTLVELPGGEILRVSGLAATEADPAIMLLESATQEQRHERATREFLRNAAHQLRTQLTGITAAVETLQAGAKERPEERDRFLGHVETHARRLTRIARGLLTLTRSQMGDDVPMDAVELRPLLEEVAASAGRKPGVRLQVDCRDGLAALASPELLQEALAGIVDNAVAHTDHGEVRLAAAARRDHVAVSVTDAGGGIPPAMRARVFEPFFRIDEDRQGYGLGLAIAAQAVAAMAGAIEVSDGPEGGTTFTVTLPSARVAR